MADRPAGEQTEQATPERLQKAREEGRVPQSQEVPSALVIVLLLVTAVLASGGLMNWMAQQVRAGLSLRGQSPGAAGFDGMLRDKMLETLLHTAPFLLAAVGASALGGLLVGGWGYSPKAMKLDFSRLSPFQGVHNMFSGRSLAQLAASLAKLAVLGVIVWQYLSGQMGQMLTLPWMSLDAIVSTIGQLCVGVAGRIAVALAAIALLDMIFQRWNYKRQLRMTRQEVREERRQHELAPELKGRIRSLQIAMARRRMLKAVPSADVVIANPQHVAVAIRYQAGAMDAPIVVAKGADFLCQKIKEIAREHDVPIVERPELARALYAAVDEGQMVPETLFVAVAEVLAMIYRIRGRRRKA